MSKITRATKDKPVETEAPVLTEEMKAFKKGAVTENDASAGDSQPSEPEAQDLPIKGPATEVKKPDELLMRTYRYKRSSWLKLKMLSDKLTVQQGKLVSLESMVEEGLQLLFKQYGIADVDLTTGFYSEQDGV